MKHPDLMVTSDLCVQQVEVVHGLLHASLTSDLWPSTLRTHQLINAPLQYGQHEERFKTTHTQETRAVSHQDDLRKRKEERKKHEQ